MCGLTFISGGSSEIRQKITAMTDLLVHRGPDFQDIKLIDNVAMGHTRLSIIDLDPRSNQPMVCSGGRYWLVFNGEIYNYREIREELGHYQFRTKSDSEVILAAYEKWGRKCLDRFNGMFAFVIYDTVNKEIFAARDRFGIKPLFLVRKSDFIALASEIKAFQPLISFKPNMEYWKDFIETGRRLLKNETCFEEVETILPGEYIFITDQQVERKSYYDLKQKIKLQNKAISHEEALSLFSEKLEQAVAYRTIADVPISLNFSGGLDSTVLMEILGRRIRHEDFYIQTGVNSDVPSDDKLFVNSLADELNFKTNFINVEECPTIGKADLRDMMWHAEMPFNLSNFLDKAMAWNSRNLGRIVILDGNGADESTLGYYSHLIPAMTHFFFTGKWIRIFKLISLNPWNSRRALISDFIKSISMRVRGKKDSSLSDRKCLGWSLIEAIEFHFDHKIHNVLAFRDRNSMAHSTELRVPFMDHEFVEAMLSLDIGMHINGLGQKNMIQNFSYKFLPKVVMSKSKNSFLKPHVPKKFQDDYHSYLSECLANSNEKVRDLIQNCGVKHFESINKKQNERVAQFVLWHKIFVERI